MPRTTAATAPPEDPPGVLRVSHGLRVTPVNGLSVTAFQPNSGSRGLADNDCALLAQPGNRRRVMRRRLARRGPGSEPRGHTGDEEVALMPIGTPSIMPLGAPAIQRASDSPAL